MNQRLPGTIYAFQEKPLGTGNAARKAAEILERMRFDGDVLVIAGDKVIDPRAVRRLLDTHERSRAEVPLATREAPAEFQRRLCDQILARQHRGHRGRGQAATVAGAGGD